MMGTSTRAARMAAVVAISAVVPLARAEHNVLTPEEIADGWILLYDGDTLFGWANHGAGKWKSQDGVLLAEEGRMGWLGTKAEFSDFVLKLQYRISADGNSGVFFRADSESLEPWSDGYEMQINDRDENFPTGSIYGVTRAKHPHAKVVTDVEKWQDVEIAAEGPHVTVKLNGVEVVHEHSANKFKRGAIGVQYHDPGGMKIEFRNIKLKPLGLKPIFNGRNLDGWKVHPGRKSVYSVTPEGWLNVKNGNGQIETEDRWDDFVFQLDIISNGNHLNSGVFFRNVPGEFWQGYESQIHNQWQGNDRTKPVDFGTGGIYRRQPARKVVSNDREWFTKTIVANGRHIAVWVNGYQTADFTDRRAVGDNPRENCCLKAGTITLQGHDPTTDLSFRNLRIAPLPE